VWFTTPVFLPSTVELVVDRDADTLTAGLRSAKDAGQGHLVLTVQGQETPITAT